MKASSFLFQSIAPPVTVFGLPPLLVALLIGAAIPFAPIFTLTGLGWMSLLGPLLIFIMGAVFLWRLRRREPHCETVYFMPQRFFKGR
ncbi:MAG: hypothetical protein ABJN43_03750, partial [Sneathiella sp.]